MAKKPEGQSFSEMFADFGKNLHLPTVDVETIMAHHRRNLEALEKSVRTAGEGASSLVSKQREQVRSYLAEITDLAQSFRPGSNPAELIEKQTAFARKSFETALKNATEAGEIVRKSGGESVEILRDRIRDAMEEIKAGYQKRD